MFSKLLLACLLVVCVGPSFTGTEYIFFVKFFSLWDILAFDTGATTMGHVFTTCLGHYAPPYQEEPTRPSRFAGLRGFPKRPVRKLVWGKNKSGACRDTSRISTPSSRLFVFFLSKKFLVREAFPTLWTLANWKCKVNSCR